MVSANDVSPGAMVKTVYSLTEEAIDKVHGKAAIEAKKAAKTIKTAKAEGAESKVDLSAYEGSYHVANYDWDLYVGLNEDGLFALPIFTDDPVGDLETWVHEKGDTFRRKRKDDTLAEAITFERDAAGKVTALVQHSYRSTKR